MNVACDYETPMQMLTTEKYIAARVAWQPAIINARGGLLCEEQGIHECTWYQILACNLILETENLLIKILTKEVTEYLEKYDYLDAVFLNQ